MSALQKALLNSAGTLAATAIAATVVPKLYAYTQDNFFQGLSTSENTVSWTQQAREGKLRRAHGRETIINNLRTAIVNHSIVMLVGPSGSGKTALVEELAYRFLEEKDDSKMYGVEILSLDQKKVEGEPGLKGAVTDLLDGGVKKRVQHIMEYLESLTDSGVIKILFIDEFQDLLQNNFKVFNQFKTMLARTGIRIIGTTTDMELIDKWLAQGGDGVGLERRVEIIKVPAMKKKETRAVLEKDFARIRREYEKTTFVFSKELAHVVVALSCELKPKGILPDRAITLLNDVCESYAAARKSDNVEIGRSEVEAYIAGRKGISVDLVHASLDAIEKGRKFRKTFEETYFPCLKYPESSPNTTSSIQAEVERLGLYFKDSSSSALLLKGSSQTLLRDIVSHWGFKEKYEVCICDAAKLAREAETEQGGEQLKKMFARLAQSERRIILVLENCSPGWLGTIPQPVTEPPQSHADFGLKSDLKRLFDPVQKKLESTSLAQFADFLGKDESPTQEKISERPAVIFMPYIIQELMGLIEKGHLLSITLLTRESTVRLEKDKGLIEISPFNLEETLNWLNDRFQLKKPQQNETADDIKKIVLALHCLQDASVSVSVIDLAAQAVDNYANSATPVDAILSVFRGKKSRKEVEAALIEGEKFLTENPFTLISDVAPAIEDAQLDQTLFNFLSSAKSGILTIIEKTQALQQCLMEQVSCRLSKTRKCIWFDHRLAMAKIPAGIKRFVVQKYHEDLQHADIVMTDEEGLKNEIFKEILSELKDPKKIIVFKKLTEASDEKNHEGLVNKLVEVGTRLINDQPAVQSKHSESIVDPFFCDFEKREFVLQELSLEDLSQLFKKKLEIQEIKEDLKSVIVSLYTTLVKQGNGIDYVLERFNNEIDQLTKLNSNTVIDKFTEIHGKTLKMTLMDVKYEVDPSLTSRRYRFVRMIKGIGTKVATGATFAFKYIVAPFTAVGIFSSGGSWLFSRYIWRR